METENISLKEKLTPLSQSIIQLQEDGFVLDFQHAGKHILCMQTGAELEIFSVKILSLESFNQAGTQHRFLYALESESGLKGIMLTDSRCLD